ncbi:FixH family protein [Bacillus carboniphilus]|uniref:FixH family protein n=1 Tax=Bacillus carboniphilus TaxID=86663 RepID=UPI0031D21E7F
MKKLTYLVILLSVMVLSACGKEDDNPGSDTNEDITLKTIEVDLQVPEHANPGEDVLIKAKVTQGDEEVEDAQAVKFEIWEKNDKDNSEMIDFTDQSGGTYGITHSFEKEAIYEVQVHVDARNMHVMPKTMIQVGEASLDDYEEQSDEQSHDEHSHSHGEGATAEEHSHHDETDITVHLADNEWHVGEESKITIHLEKEENPYTEARVRLEIWQEGNKQHDWVDATESNPGKYEASYNFTQSGEFQVKIHVEHEDGTHIHTQENVHIH